MRSPSEALWWRRVRASMLSAYLATLVISCELGTTTFTATGSSSAGSGGKGGTLVPIPATGGGMGTPADAGLSDAGSSQCTTPFRPLSVRPWPGRGIQVIAEWAEGGAGRIPEVTVVSPDGDAVLAAARATPAARGITGIVLFPTARSRLLELQQAARALIDALPPEERIALWVVDDGLRLHAEITEDKVHLARRLGEITALAREPGTGSLPVRLSSGQRDALRERLAAVEGPWGAPSRFLVVLGGEPPALDEHPVAGLHWGGGGLADSGSMERWGRRGDEVGRALAAHIASRRDRIVTLGTCGQAASGAMLWLSPAPMFGPDAGVEAADPAAGADAAAGASSIEASTRTAYAPAGCGIRVPEPIEHEVGAACDAEAAASDAYPFSPRIELLLSDEQRVAYDARWEAKSEEEFDAALRFGDATPIPTTAHFRGQTSLDCARKSLSIDLKGPALRRLVGAASSDEFYLISLCKDDHYFRQLFASRLMRSLGLFPLDSRLVDFRINGVSQGVYLLLEKPTHALRQDATALYAIVRRRLDADDKPPDVKFPKEEPARSEALAAYEQLALMAQEGDPESLLEELGAAMAFDNYLRFVATNTLLINGDYTDEVFFYAAYEGGRDERLYFRTIAWDEDDLGQACHHQGRFAFDRGNGLMYCVEADLDRSLMRSDAAYARYASLLEELLAGPLAPSVLDRELVATREALFGVLQDDAVCAAMERLVAADERNSRCDFMRQSISDAIEVYRGRLMDNHATLRGAVRTVLEETR